jgi:hypothetical protein
MNIAIFYIARSKSTMVHNILAKKFNLAPLKELLFFSRRQRQDFEEYPKLIEQINTQDNICVKICINDFIDSKNNRVVDDYKKIDYTKFDHLIFIERDDLMGQVASFGHHNKMNFADFDKSHRKKGQDFEGHTYDIDLGRSAYILRGYRLMPVIREWVEQQAVTNQIYDIKFETAEQQLIEKFDLKADDFDIDIEACGLDYKKLATNYAEVEAVLPDLRDRIMSADLKDINNPESNFWKDNVSFY